MDVSVDSLPELTPEYQQAQQQAVQDAKVVYQFEEVIVPATDYWTISLWSLFGAGSLWLVWWAVSDGLWTLAVIILCLTAGILSYLYYAGNPDTKQTVTLTEKGIIVTELTLVPDACFAALRYSGYVGIAISLIGVVLVGPMMFVGAGAGLLMSFKMAGVVNRPRQRVRPFPPNASYSIYIVPEGRYKHGLIESQLLPKIEKAVDSEENRAIYRENRIFYSFCCIASPEVQEQFLKHLKQLVTLTEEE
ncbi:hypothetical protein [Vibrio neptunius]|uniref:Uncharacterized protein n=1 Tax=Vibrio neptunius TaxID=170651 RepID=A0ABS3A8Y2_9VIBR|nr:hypothetical protein [Vibrio neptunius]MBN3495321.1 hypothetical protein [Vibrio neptunius]MBN3517795.1 hypothetical protein [Vibrio neptunius]MBN3552164.1 hypothetical protein [Vibrio neptunius]MBN3580167.1 hypothetical protein [Vibrio neptunius]MCH9873833.1 hypothetical protein [Vibrio neptunius]